MIADALSRISIDHLEEKESAQVLVVTRAMTKNSECDQTPERPKVVEEEISTFSEIIPRIKTNKIELKAATSTANGNHQKCFEYTIKCRNNGRYTVSKIISRLEAEMTCERISTIQYTVKFF